MGIKTTLKELLIRQCRGPAGWLGEYVTHKMNVRHGPLTRWGLGHVRLDKTATLLDIGCGGGKTVQRLSAIAPEGRVYGLDPSAKSVAVSRRTNRQAIRDGRVTITQGAVSALPYADNLFDCVTAVETHYFWPDLAADFREVRRVLKPGGTFLLVGEVYRCAKFDARNQEWLRLLPMGYYSAEELRHAYATAGYADVTVDEEPNEGWICCLGRNAAPI